LIQPGTRFTFASMSLLRITLTLSLLALFGCSSVMKPRDAVTGPFFAPTNIRAAAKIPAEVRRVVVLPVAGGPSLTEETLNVLDSVIQAELNKTGKFEVVPLTRDDLAKMTGSRQINSVEKLPTALIDKLFNIYNPYSADAVLLVDVTAYSPYTPLVLGLRTKLARVTDGDIIWAADNVFSASDPTVANSARKHAETLGSDRGPTNLNHTILQNPQRFAGYVAAATFQTLPPR
jgi:hypothetical protein